jgi:serine protease
MLSVPYTDQKYHYKYTGKDVTVYVLDSGIDLQHPEFGGRASCGWDRGQRFLKLCLDQNSHGTHVAGTIGGKTYGVAKNVKLVSVKVLGSLGYGWSSTTIAGIDWVVGQKRKNPNKPMIINMSLGGSKSLLVNGAVEAATAAGITVVVAAGNDKGANACRESPASAASAITVGSTNPLNYVSSFTNGGPCVDIMAPGESIESAWACDKFRPKRCLLDISYFLSGTSTASSLVAGVAALHLDKTNSLTPQEVWDAIQSDARTGAVIDHKGYNVPDLLVSAVSILE